MARQTGSAGRRRASSRRCRCRTPSRPAGRDAGASTQPTGPLELQNVTSWPSGKHSLRAGLRLRGDDQWADSRQSFNGTVTFAGTFGPELDAVRQPGARREWQTRHRPGDEHRPLPPHGLPRVARLLPLADPPARRRRRASCASRAATRTRRCASGTSASSSQDDWKPRARPELRPRPALRGADERRHGVRPRAAASR